MTTERRRWLRRSPEASEPLRRVRSRTGRDLDVIDLSPGGLLVEGAPRILPNTHLDLHIVTRHGRVLVRCRVIRAWVWQVTTEGIRYRAGLALDRLLDTAPGYSVPDPGPLESAGRGSAYPEGDAPNGAAGAATWLP